MTESKDSRRWFIKAATLAIGGAIGAVLALPLVRYVFFPVGRKIVADSGGALDVMDADALEPGAPPVRVQISATEVRDAWGVADDVPVGSAWIRKSEDGKVQALSSACPHLGCAVDFDQPSNTFKCPCHKSAFAPDGEKLSGPSKRGLDPLPVEVEGGRVKITFLRFRPDIGDREPV